MFDLISDEFKDCFPKFKKYYLRNFFTKYPLTNLDWNNDLKNTLDQLDINNYFFTNNICESTYRTLNHNYKDACKTLISFEGAIKK